MDRILVDTGATHEATFYADGVPTDPTGNTATVSVLKADATAVPPTATTRLDVGRFSWVQPAIAAPDFLSLAWTATFAGVTTTIRTDAEIVGGFYFSVAELRAHHPSLADAVKYTPALLAVARIEAEDEAERIMDRSFVDRYRTDSRRVEDGRFFTSRPNVGTLRKVSALSKGSAVTIDLADCYVDGVARVHVPVPDGSLVTLAYEHGDPEPPPAQVVEVMMMRARHIAQRVYNALPESTERATITDLGVIARLLPKVNATGNALADAVYQSHRLD